MIRFLTRHNHTLPRPPLSIAIRREDKNRWERRTPLTPTQISSLVSTHATKVLIQPSNRRIFPDAAYQSSGAVVTEDISSADIIIGVKEVPVPQLVPNKTYMFFSHTHKAQPYNMPLLKHILSNVILLFVHLPFRKSG